MSLEDARSKSYSFFKEADPDKLESRAKAVKNALSEIEKKQEGLNKYSLEWGSLQDKKESLNEAQFGSFLAIFSRKDGDLDEDSLTDSLGYDPSDKMKNLIKFLDSSGNIDLIKEEGHAAWSGSKGLQKINNIYNKLPEKSFIELMKKNDQFKIKVKSEEGSGEGSEVDAHLADFLEEGFCPPDPLNDDYFRRNPKGKDCPVKIKGVSKDYIKSFLINNQTDSMLAQQGVTKENRSKLTPKKSDILNDVIKELLEQPKESGSPSTDPTSLEDIMMDLRLNSFQDMMSDVELDKSKPASILIQDIISGAAPIGALSEGTDPPLDIMGKTSSLLSLYYSHKGGILYSESPPFKKRNTLMKKMSRQDARLFTSNLDKIASLIQNEGRLLGIPAKVAMDFAYRCDLLSDAAERHTGLRVAGGIENEIGETEHEHGFTQNFDELEDLVDSGMGKKSYLNHIEEDHDDIWEDY